MITHEIKKNFRELLRREEKRREHSRIIALDVIFIAVVVITTVVGTCFSASVGYAVFTIDQKLCESVRKVVSKKIEKAYEDINRTLNNLDPNDDADVLWEPLTLEEKKEDIDTIYRAFCSFTTCKNGFKSFVCYFTKRFRNPKKGSEWRRDYLKSMCEEPKSIIKRLFRRWFLGKEAQEFYFIEYIHPYPKLLHIFEKLHNAIVYRQCQSSCFGRDSF